MLGNSFANLLMGQKKLRAITRETDANFPIFVLPKWNKMDFDGTILIRVHACPFTISPPLFGNMRLTNEHRALDG